MTPPRLRDRGKLGSCHARRIASKISFVVRTMLLLLVNQAFGRKELTSHAYIEERTNKRGSGQRDDPGDNDAACNIPPHRRSFPRRADTDNRARDGMSLKRGCPARWP